MDIFSIIKDGFNLLINKKYSYISKGLSLLIIVITLLFVDNYLGFSFYYKNNQKVTQIQKIEDIKKGNIDKKVLLFLNQTELNIINHQNFTDTIPQNIDSNSFLWHVITSSFISILFMFIFPLIPFIEKRLSWKTFLGMFMFLILDILSIFVFQYLFGLIPLIYSPYINYSLNIILHSVIWIIFYKYFIEIKE